MPIHTEWPRQLLLLLMRSPAISLRFTILGDIFLRMCPFANPTIEVVTFRLRGWCMLGVFLLPAFTRLGHERQDLMSTCDGMHGVHRLDLGLYSHPKEFWEMESEPMLTSKQKSPLPERNSPQGSMEPTTLHQAGQRAQHTTNELFRPPHQD